MRAADVWESARFTSIFLALGFFYISGRIHARPHAANANRSAASANARTSAKTSSALHESARKRTVMENETHASNVFKIENCRAKNGAGDLVNCLAPEQAHICGFSLPFGFGYFCKHPRRNEFIEIAEKLRSKLISPPHVSQSDNQE
jgi:hypothetical protein